MKERSGSRTKHFDSERLRLSRTFILEFYFLLRNPGYYAFGRCKAITPVVLGLAAGHALAHCLASGYDITIALVVRRRPHLV